MGKKKVTPKPEPTQNNRTTLALQVEVYKVKLNGVDKFDTNITIPGRVAEDDQLPQTHQHIKKYGITHEGTLYPFHTIARVELKGATSIGDDEDDRDD
jgi:hypothetical protein